MCNRLNWLSVVSQVGAVSCHIYRLKTPFSLHKFPNSFAFLLLKSYVGIFISVMSSDKQPQYCFKSTTFEHTSKVGNKKKVWKSLKQILASEKALKWPENTVLCKLINK